MSPSRRCARRTDRGFTLLEMLLVTSLFSIFIVGVYEAVLVGLRAANASDEREDVRQRMAHALDRLTREAAQSYAVDQAEDARFQFDARDINGDSADDTNIDYQYASGALTRTEDGTTITLLSGITSFDLNYTDLTGAAMTTPVAGSDEDDVRVVHVAVTAARDQETLSLESSAYLRNMN